MTVLILSRQFGAGGKTLGENLAKRLGFQFVDRDIIAQVAREANVSVDWVVAVERETGGRLMKILSKMVSGDFIQRMLSDSGSDFDEEKYAAFVKKVVKDIAKEGNTVILGRGSQFIVPDQPGVFKVLLVGEKADREKFLEKKYKLSAAEARQVVAKEDRKRAAFLVGMDAKSPDDPLLYHLCINTSKMSLEQAEEMIVDLIEARKT